MGSPDDLGSPCVQPSTAHRRVPVEENREDENRQEGEEGHNEPFLDGASRQEDCCLNVRCLLVLVIGQHRHIRQVYVGRNCFSSVRVRLPLHLVRIRLRICGLPRFSGKQWISLLKQVPIKTLMNTYMAGLIF